MESIHPDDGEKKVFFWLVIGECYCSGFVGEDNRKWGLGTMGRGYEVVVAIGGCLLGLDNFPVVVSLVGEKGLVSVRKTIERWIPYGSVWVTTLVVRSSSARVVGRTMRRTTFKKYGFKVESEIWSQQAAIPTK